MQIQGLRQGPKEKRKWKFLQKYHHKGSYFMDEDSIREAESKEGKKDVRKREGDGAVGEDLFDKSMLPKVMQVRNFGRSSRTKWTHLVDNDTTSWESPWAADSAARAKYNSRMAGVKGNLNDAGRVVKKRKVM